MVFIDGGYLRKLLRDMFGDDNLDYGAFVNMLRKDTMYGPLYPQLVRAYYYDAVPETETDAKFTIQKDYLARVADNDFVEVRTGRLKRTASGKTRQKGVDTIIAIDMLSKAYEDHYDVAVLVAGDDDFLDLVKAVKDAGKQIYGAFFLKNVSRRLREEFDRRLFLKKEVLSKLRGKI